MINKISMMKIYRISHHLLNRKRMTNYYSIVVILILIFNNICLSQPGSLDSDFNGGKITFSIDGKNNLESEALHLQSDGKIVIMGNAKRESVMIRYNPNGILDHTFGMDGLFFNAEFECDDFLILENNKKILVGTTYLDKKSYTTILQLTSDGEIDKSFGDNGFVYCHLSVNEGINRILLQPDGKILLIGTQIIKNTLEDLIQQPLIYRYHIDGSIDESFGVDGAATLDPEIQTYFTRFGILQEDGKILIGGFRLDLNNGDNSGTVVFRFNNDGTLDESFAEIGYAYYSLDGFNMTGLSIGIVGNAIYVGFELGQGNIGLMKLMQNGDLDESFGYNGYEVYDTKRRTELIDMIIQKDDKILLLATEEGNYPDRNFLLLRLNEDGSRDISFGQNGEVITSFNSWDTPSAMIIQSDNKIVTAGFSIDNNEKSSIVSLRYLSGLETNINNIKLDQENLSIFPNPIHHEAVFSYTINQNQEITIDLFDINGKWIQTFIHNEKRSKGTYQEKIILNPSIEAGTYFLTINRKVGIKVLVNR